MKNKSIKLAKNQGQVAIEYTLMVAVIVVLLLGVFNRLRDFLVGRGDCPNDSLVCRIIGTYSGPGFFSGNFRAFTIRR